MSTSQKHRDFIMEPMGQKNCTDLAGIGVKLGERLTTEGFDKVCCLKTILISILIICY